MDPLQFRLQNIATQATDMANGVTALTWDRWKKVLDRAGQLSNWQPRVAASKQTGNIVTGRGVALGTFAGTPVANIAEIKVNKKTGKITPVTFYCAQDTGLTVYPEGVANQAVGSLVQGASRALHESVAFNKQQVTSLDWVTYPIMRFKDSPTIDVRLRPALRHPGDEHGHGAGERHDRSDGTGRERRLRGRLGRAAVDLDRRGDRERVLRRDGRAHPLGADDAGARRGGAEGGRGRLDPGGDA